MAHIVLIVLNLAEMNWKGDVGPPPRIIFAKISTKSCTTFEFISLHIEVQSGIMIGRDRLYNICILKRMHWCMKLLIL